MTDPREDERRRRAAVERDAEAARAVAFLASKGAVEAGAVELLTRYVAAELATLCEEADRFERETLAPIDAAREQYPTGGTLADAEARDGVWRRNKAERAKAIGDLAPLDKALVRRLRELAGRARSEAEAARGERAKKAREADAEAADKAAAEVEAKARETWARDVDKGPLYWTPWALVWTGDERAGWVRGSWAEKWNTVHESGLPVEPLGVSWPPDAQSARGGMRLPQEGDPGWPLWCEAHAAAGVDHTLRARQHEDGEAQRQVRAAQERFVDAFNRYRAAVLAAVEAAPEGWAPSARIMDLALALWNAGGWGARWAQRARSHVPTIHGVTFAVLAPGTRTQDAHGNIVRHGENQGRLPSVPAAARVVLEHSGEMKITVDAWAVFQLLVRRVWARYRNMDGPRDSLVVCLDVSKHELGRLYLPVGKGEPAARVGEALDWMKAFRFGNERIVEDWFPLDAEPGKNGRPPARFEVRCGFAVAPYALASHYASPEFRNVLRLPEGMGGVSGVLTWESVPLAGDHRTHHAQRAALALGVPAWLMTHREEYAERGGLMLGAAEVKEWERWSADRFGLYVRKNHASLPKSVLEAAREGDKGRGRTAPALAEVSSAPWPGGPILVEVNGRWRMRDEGQHRLIVEAAETTREQRARRAGGGKRRG